MNNMKNAMSCLTDSRDWTRLSLCVIDSNQTKTKNDKIF